MTREHDGVEVKIQVAKINERMTYFTKDLQDHRIMEQAYQRQMTKTLDQILTKIGEQNTSIQQYKNDRVWLIGIIGVLWSGLLAWVEIKK